MNFELLTSLFDKTHNILFENTIKAININITIRNWLFGFYIVEYEQNGEDRAKYGEHILSDLEKYFKISNIKGITERRLREFRKFYLVYPKIRQTLTNVFEEIIVGENYNSIRRALTAELQVIENNIIEIPIEKLINKLSYTHFLELSKIENSLKRLFYEIECIKGSWSVRELERQINSLYFERMQISENPEKMSQIIQSKTDILSSKDIIKSHFAFEFLGLQNIELIEETDLEQALINNFQYFMLELGRGFCLESRQKRILIGDEYFFIDLVFYHRILKCHVIVELKADKFNHSHISQLNTYVNYYKSEICDKNDNPPIGILLVAQKNKPLVEFALMGVDNNLFVSEYLLQLPTKEQLTNFIINELQKF